MSFLMKEPDAALDYELDWGADYLIDDVLIDSMWSVTPDEPGGLNIVSHEHDATRSTVTVGSGIAGHVYRLANKVTTDCGLSDTRSIQVRVEAR